MDVNDAQLRELGFKDADDYHSWDDCYISLPANQWNKCYVIHVHDIESVTYDIPLRIANYGMIVTARAYSYHTARKTRWQRVSERRCFTIGTDDSIDVLDTLTDFEDMVWCKHAYCTKRGYNHGQAASREVLDDMVHTSPLDFSQFALDVNTSGVPAN
jgi:hypothetical protein